MDMSLTFVTLWFQNPLYLVSKYFIYYISRGNRILRLIHLSFKETYIIFGKLQKKKNSAFRYVLHLHRIW